MAGAGATHLSARLRQIPTARKILYSAIVAIAVLLLGEGAARVRAWARYGTASTTARPPMLEYDATTALWVPIPGYEIRGNKIPRLS